MFNRDFILFERIFEIINKMFFYCFSLFRLYRVTSFLPTTHTFHYWLNTLLSLVLDF